MSKSLCHFNFKALLVSVITIRVVSSLAVALVLSLQLSAQTASNGLNKAGNDIRLGGILSQPNTAIDLSTYTFKFYKTGVGDYFNLANNGNIGIGVSLPSYKLDVNGPLRLGSLTADPLGAAGVLYYNSALNKLKAYVNGGWKNVLVEGEVGNDYIQNQTSTQQNASFNIGGSGSFGGTLSLAQNVYMANNSRIMATNGSYTNFIGVSATGVWPQISFKLNETGATGTYASGNPKTVALINVYNDVFFQHAGGSGRFIIQDYSGDGLQLGTMGQPILFNFGGTDIARFAQTTQNFLLNKATDNITDKLQVGGNVWIQDDLKLPKLATTTPKMLTVGADGLVASADMPSTTSSVVSGNTIYVDKNNLNATDSRTGISKYSLEKPFKTIQAAVNALSSNEIVWVRGGTYNESVHFIDDGGYNYINQGLVLENAGIIGGQKTLDLQVGWFSNVFVKGIGNAFILNNTGDGTPALNVRGFHIENGLTIENVTITNTSGVAAVFGQGNYGTTLRNVTIQKTGGTGYAVNGNNLIFRECDISSVDKGFLTTNLIFYNSNVYTEGLNIYFDNTVDFQSYYSRFYSKNDANVTGANWGSLTKIENSNFEANTFNVNIWYNNTMAMKASLKNNSFISHSNPAVTVSIVGLSGGETTYITGNTSNGNINISGGGYSSPTIVKTNNVKTNLVNATGDMLYRDADGMITNLAKGTVGQALTVKTDGSLGWETITDGGSGDGGGSISISPNQVAYGSAPNTVTGNNNLTFDGSMLAVNGTLGINTSGINASIFSQYKLAVNGNAIFTRIKVKESSQWADYVFEPGYRLLTLKEVDAFIKAHKHLPEVPSAAEVKKEGLDIGDNQVMLLKKIEELTLYAIEQNKKIEKLETESKDLNQLRKEFELLKALIKNR